MKKTNENIQNLPEGILPVNKPGGISSFTLVRWLRRHLNIKKIGHAGTLDPFATGVMVMLIGKQYTRLSDLLINDEKEYEGRIHLGVVTDSYDCDGQVIHRSSLVPNLDEVNEVIAKFQGEILQIPPMFSAKKQQGKKLYQLARHGITVEREPVRVNVKTTLVAYSYPYLDIHVQCSKGTYIRTIAHEIGTLLGCGGHLCTLSRTQSGFFHLRDCYDGEQLRVNEINKQELIQSFYTMEQLALK